jgi:valyl-tRNA synthetase
MQAMDKQYNPGGLEQKWYRRWEEAGLFRPEAGRDGEPFVIVLPPPNVTGTLHIGHCLGNSVQDCLIRYGRMSGRPTLWLPGTDHASIATEQRVVQVLAEEGTTKQQLGREGFLARAWDWNNRHHDRIVEQLKRFGCSLDWTREAFTLDEPRSRAVAEAFVRLYRKGLIYRGDYMVNWSVAQQSAVSDEEVEHREVQGSLWHIRYPLEGGGHLVVATTRPETMLGDTAIAIHPAHARTAPLRGRAAILPLVGRRLPIVLDEHVDPEFGSGCVKVTPAHDPNDYEIGKRHGLPFVNILNPDGTLNDSVPQPYRGLDRFAARKQVVADLQAQGLLDKVEPHVHNVGYHDRTGTIIEPYISRQWFLRMDELAKPALRAVEEGAVRIVPERWVGVYFNWMRNIKDWCISRQLWWGHRIPVWTCATCHELTVQTQAPVRCTACGGLVLEQDQDVLDTWFSSWLWTFSPLGWPQATADLQRYHPTSVLVTGHEIIFFWVARMMMASYEFLGEPPFREILFTGIVRDPQGRKMSKSLGNSPDPIDLMDQSGADALRFTLLMQAPAGQDMNFGAESVETGRNFCNKIWNASRLLFSALAECGLAFPAAQPQLMEPELSEGLPDDDEAAAWTELYRRAFGALPPTGERAPLALEDRWILVRVAAAASRLEEAVATRRLNDAALVLYDCFWHDYCDWYLETIKPRLSGADAAARNTALLTALLAHGVLLRLLHPFLPYLTEELWEQHPATAGFCMIAPLPRFAQARRCGAPAWQPLGREATRFDLARALVAAARSLRSDFGVAPGRRGTLVLRAEPARLAELGAIRAHVELLAKMERVEIGPAGSRPSRAVAAVVEGVEVYLPVDGLVDLARQRDRLLKERERVERRLSAIRAKLSNAGFLAKAPRAVVQQQEEIATDLEGTLAKLQDQIAVLE